ncbi:MAG: inositol monophosphatase family protein [Myxococcales bacterium]|nr:inositol monophosphatase [Myxococcota bacterium]MDW8281715.1 inositol monophosphatase family protein [Myxococcales bacterium]
MAPRSEDLLYLDTARALAEEAGAVLRAGAMSPQQAESKGERADLVTRFDREAEQTIVAGLRARYPSHAVLAEEGGAQPGSPDAPRWIVDPLDGTTNFAHGLPLFSVSIACEVQGVVRVGVVVAPALGWTFTAVRGGGAFCNGRPLAVSQTTVLDEALLVTGFPYDKRSSEQDNLAQFAALEKRVHGVRRLGSAALDLALVACGWLDGYWEMKMKPWDLAAGLLLVEEAGGRTSDWQGRPVNLWQGDAVATNGHLHEALLAALGATQRGPFR